MTNEVDTLKEQVKQLQEERDIFKNEFINAGTIGWKTRCKEAESERDQLKSKIEKMVDTLRKINYQDEREVVFALFELKKEILGEKE